MPPTFDKLIIAASIALSLSGCVPEVSGQNSQQSRTDVVSQSITLLSHKRFSEALAEIKKLRPLAGADPTPIMVFAIASDMQGEFNASSRAYAKLGDTHSQRPDLLNNMGYSMMLQGNLDQALLYLREAQRLDPTNLTIKNNLKMLTRVVPTR